jgi:hypothetical protein
MEEASGCITRHTAQECRTHPGRSPTVLDIMCRPAARLDTAEAGTVLDIGRQMCGPLRGRGLEASQDPKHGLEADPGTRVDR